MLFLILLIVALDVCGATSSPGDTNDLIATTQKPPYYCFKRISTGERLVGYDVTRIVEKDSVRGCEHECNIYKLDFTATRICSKTGSCNSLSVLSGDIRGNGSCELTTDRQISRRQDPSFDLYERTSECVEGKPTGYEEGIHLGYREYGRTKKNPVFWLTEDSIMKLADCILSKVTDLIQCSYAFRRGVGGGEELPNR
ncbi:hypothetical protein RUM44_006333 [Polyplax serrata]|uniref:Apple domain-containing protein n=1 Tax=Polyplax serrata TaxID=468196 RepID=A0ABR1AHS9_POLSC